ncbi:MAG TPA: hypothetical protein VF053_03630 [Streptosporangiales bacterium]
MDRRIAAGIGLKAWFFGNLYEAVVGMPQLLADARAARAGGLLGTGSPVRYYVPVAPLAFGATAATLVRGWRAGGDCRAVAATAVSTASAAALSGYLIRSVNARLVTGGEPLGEDDRRRLVATWHVVNGVRLGALVVAMASLARIAR